MDFFAHSASVTGRKDTVASHLRDVAKTAAELAGVFDASDEALLAGLLHDLGKYGELFQDRLLGRERGIDHWSAGAWVALERYKHSGIAAALAIQGHHIGLQRADKDSLMVLEPSKLARNHPLSLRLSEPEQKTLLERFDADGFQLGKVPRSLYDHQSRSAMPAAAMLDVRMLFSTLVDADFIETEAHFQAALQGIKRYRNSGPNLNPARDMEALHRYLDRLANSSTASEKIRELRLDLLSACLQAAEKRPGLFTLTAPTGSGKTLAMLAFALKHARLHGLRRIMTVIPYLTIIEQTAREYREALKEAVPPEQMGCYVLEDHSLARTGSRDSNGGPDDGAQNHGASPKIVAQPRLLAENWDAPIVLTTSVQLLESLFSNRPASCRKLHRLAKSIILFDEVQTLPSRLAIPTLATLSRLAERYGATVVFATATQPAFSRLDEHVRKYCAGGWQPREIVPDKLRLFHRAKRTRLTWPRLDQKVAWADLAEMIAQEKQALCVVNLKRQVVTLFDELKRRKVPNLFHLSTNMCPAHRQAVLKDVRGLLGSSDRPCILISTQCVEAGVDVDFPKVFRAMGPLEAVAQAAGRCNRNGRSKSGDVVVFVPEDNEYPDGAYRQAASVAWMLLSNRGATGVDIDDPSVFRDYYGELYSVVQPQQRSQDLQEALRALDFADVADRYRVIEKDAVNVLVPYDQQQYLSLAADARQNGLSRSWIAKARPYSISVSRPRKNNANNLQLEPIRFVWNQLSEDWFIYPDNGDYDADKGLASPASTACWIA